MSPRIRLAQGYGALNDLAISTILYALSLTPVAGLIFKTKNRAIFLERFFGREITAREQLSRAVILARF